MIQMDIKITSNYICPKSWDDLSGTGTQRFCVDCNKQVTDLRGKSNEEVFKTIGNKQVCAVVHRSKLTSGSWISKASFGIITLLIFWSSQIKAQVFSSVALFSDLNQLKIKFRISGKVLEGHSELKECRRALVEVNDILGNRIFVTRTSKLGQFEFTVVCSTIGPNDPVVLEINSMNGNVLLRRTTIAELSNGSQVFCLSEDPTRYIMGDISASWETEKNERKLHLFRRDWTDPKVMSMQWSAIKQVVSGRMND